MQKFTSMFIIIAIILLCFNNTSYGGGVELWSRLDDTQKRLYFLGMRDGIQAMAMHADIPKEKMEELTHILNNEHCNSQIFDTIYSQQINIKASFLFLLSTKVCKGEITPSQFIQLVDKVKNK